MLFVEHTDFAWHNEGKQLSFLPDTQIDNVTGFRTIAKWTEQACGLALAAGTVTALRDSPCTIDTLYVDFDDNEKDAMVMRSWLKEEGFLYEMWSSGGRSQHFHIPILPLHSVNAPSSTKSFMHNNCNALCYDSSIYHYAALFRLPGTIHAKTGKKKELLEMGSGSDLLKIDLTEPKRFDSVFIVDVDEYTVTMNRYLNLLQNCPTVGNRSVMLWSMSRAFFEVGLDFETALELIRRMNLSWKDGSKSESKVIAQVRSAYL